MNVSLDKPKLAKYRNDAKALSFSVILHYDNVIHLVIAGFRCIDGVIQPPKSFQLKGHKYYQIAFLSQEIAEKIYAAFKEKDWVKKFELPDLASKKAAITELVLTIPKANLVAPSLVPEDQEEEEEELGVVPAGV